MKMVDMEATGKNIKRLIKKNNLSYRDIQKACLFRTDKAIYKWMQGRSLPTIDNLVILADLFHCTMDDIIVVDRR